MVTLQLRQIDVPPGQRVLFHDVSWQEFEAILEELGEERTSRIAYSHGILEIMTPLPEHEKPKVILADLVKILLDEMGLDWEPYGSTTFRRQDMAAGIEPDDCFYIQNAARMVGLRRLDLAIDPPPDLAIEIDVTSRTKLSAYEALQVPEIWRYENRELKIFVLQAGVYVDSVVSPTFPNMAITEVIPKFIEQSWTAGVSSTLRSFRQWVRQQG
jgi:Uma2 family endonuclease